MKDTTLKKIKADFLGAQWPAILNLDERPNQYVMDLSIKPDIVWFEGHFPGQPVLAGVVQTHWAGEFAKYLFPVGEDFKRLDNLKFKAVILPKMRMQLILTYFPDNKAVTFSYADCGNEYSAGKLVFG